MALTVCIETGCPNLTDKRRCPAHARAADQARGKRAHGSGTDWQHTKLRRSWQRRMDAGEAVDCWRCGRPIDRTDWHLGHDDHDRRQYRGPEHPHCNLSAAGKAAHRISPRG